MSNSNTSVYIIAEAGVNHNGSMVMARSLIDKAKEANADAVKFQMFKAHKLVSQTAPKAQYQKEAAGGSNAEETQFKMLQKLELTPQNFAELKTHADMREIQFLCTPFDTESLKYLSREIHVTAIKLGSGEITNAPFLVDVGLEGKPVILSTGLATLEDVKAALGALSYGLVRSTAKPSKIAFEEAYASLEGQQALYEKVTLLHCTTEYPAPYCDVNLSAMQTLRTAFGLKVGFSDHTSGISVPIAAAALGACVIEKHFTLDPSLPGPDHKASLSPFELRDMVTGIRQVSAALGNGIKVPMPSELKNISVARRSLVASQPIAEGEVFSEKNIDVKRPGTGVSPFSYWDYLGRKALRAYKKDEALD